MYALLCAIHLSIIVYCQEEKTTAPGEKKDKLLPLYGIILVPLPWSEVCKHGIFVCLVSFVCLTSCYLQVMLPLWNINSLA